MCIRDRASNQENGTQRYRCHNGQCERQIFLLQYQDHDRAPEVRRLVVGMALNGSGIHDTARVLRISPTTVITVLKKTPHTATRQPCVPPLSSFLRRSRPTTSRRRAR